jgi:hypothetical protein
MPYNRDEVIASVTKFYTFLTTHLHFDPSELKNPPPDGWTQITSTRFTDQHKSDTVIDLLQHLPYLPGGNDAEKFIYDLTVCADYTIESVPVDNELDVPEIVEECPREKLKDLSRREHIVSLGFPKTVRLRTSISNCHILFPCANVSLLLFIRMPVTTSTSTHLTAKSPYGMLRRTTTRALTAPRNFTLG